MSESASSQHREFRSGLTSGSFVGLLCTQFLGAMNDNMFRWLVVPIAKPVIGAAEALSLGLACFTIPYLLLASSAGFLADRFSKRTVIVGCKVAEIGIMLFGLVAILLGNITLLFVVVALMGCQSALFGPAKYGSIPEMLTVDRLSKGNGWMGLVTVVASAIGFIAGNWLFSISNLNLTAETTLGDLAPAACALLGVAVVGWLTSLLIVPLPAADPQRPLPPNPVSETYRNLRLLGSNIPLLRTALGIAFFWMLASLAQMNIDLFGINELGLEQKDIGPLLGVLVLGLGLGSVLAGLWSGGRVELGIVPLGAAGIAFSAVMLYVTGINVDIRIADSAEQAHDWAMIWLLLLGVSAGLFNIPLETYLQHRSDVKTRGTILAASNFIAFSLILVASGLFLLMRRGWELSASEIFLLTGLGTLPVGIYIFSLLPDATIRFVVWLASHTVYRVRVYGRENLPERGGALLVANHVSWLDGVLLLLTSSRPIRMIAYADYIQGWGIRWLCKTFGVIPIKTSDGPKALVRSLQTARTAVQNGELVCIFAEGEITRTGQLQPFQRGLMRIVEGTGAPVVPVYLDELWGSIFSYHGGRFFWKWPRRWPYPVSIHFGQPLADPDNIYRVRQAVQTLGVESVEKRKTRQLIPIRQFIRRCKAGRGRLKIADSSGQELTNSRTLMGTIVLARLLRRHVLADDERMVGVLLPPSVGGVLANTSLSLLGRVVVNVNYTLSDKEANYCLREAGVKHVLTSRRFLEKRPMKLDAELVFLEDLKEQATSLDKLAALAQTYLLPSAMIDRLYRLTSVDPDDLMTIIFTSGSTGEPKGVMLSQSNIQTNIEAANHLFHFKSTDVVMGVLPFFHSFGYTFTLWMVLNVDAKAVYHFNPVDARQIGKLSEKYGMTVLAATPTFLKTYLKRCSQEQFKNLDLVIAGAEKLPSDLADVFEKQFGVRPTEGYGTTELSPLVACNVPDHRSAGIKQRGTKAGTVGRAIPGVSTKIVHPETGEELGTNEEGLLWISGPNVMQGYLNKPEQTAQVIQDGWYNTGDIARIDDEGFIEITGRQSRFSKIGGEMVPHIRIEEELARIVEDHDSDEPAVLVAVTAVPDAKKGERIVVLHRPWKKSVDEVLKELNNSELPNLWLPSRDSFLEVPEIPLLGTGKLDLKGVKQLALEKFAPPSDSGMAMAQPTDKKVKSS